MKPKLTRRSFGVLATGLTGALALGAPRLGYAQAAAYANPQLLMEPAPLLAAITPASGSAATPAEIGLAIVDVRPRAEYVAGHIPGAVHLDPNAVVAPHSPVEGALRPTSEIEALLGEMGIAADSIVVFYDDRGGFHAARMLWLMEYLGHRTAAVLNGGWSGWVRQGAPVSTEEPQPEAALFQAALSPRRHATAEDVLLHRDADNGVLIDVRPTHMFDEGHIPWAVNVPWAMNLGDDDRFRSADALLSHFGRYGVTPEHDVVMHCQNGLASSHSYVALRVLGFPRVRVYHRSWAEWGADPSLPKTTS